MNIAPLLLYVAASIGYGWHFMKRSSRGGRTATSFLVAATLVHPFIIGMQTTEIGHLPLVGTTGALSVFVWLSSIAYLYTETTSNERSMGVFIAPLLVALQIIPTISRYEVAVRPPVLESPWFVLHISSLLFAYASFSVACVIGITYMLLFKELKARHVGFFYNRLPSLQILDVMNMRAITIGWLFLTIGVIVGGVWALQAQAEFDDPETTIPAFRRCRCFTRRYSSLCCAGSSTRLSFMRGALLAGPAGAPRSFRSSDSLSCY